ncbi:MAG TPA: phage baseplate assembly protein V, partial [Stellaceae bacterium]|nr:phage baseplate assembly protein V [Stellaceae bacterium]
DFFGKIVGRKQTRVFTGAVNDPSPDFILAMAGAGFNNIAKNQLQAAFQPTKPGSVASTSNPAATSSQAALYSNENYFGAGALAQIASFMPYFFNVLTSGFQELGEQIAGVDCSINFAAVPSNVSIVPLPAGVRAFVRGPHLATVIGPNGALKADGSDATGIYHDALGRVRIRFPWDRGPPDSNDAAGKVAPPAKTRDPLKTADNTCWVRVTQGWAGRGRGIQFLPRIGEEVIVDFLDGDPDRPIITGRVYNADQSFANLPFPADDRHKDPKAVPIPAEHLSNPKPPTTSGFTRSGIKTTTLRNGEEVPTRFHLLRFDDDSAREQVLLRSQHRLDITAFEKRYESIHSDRHLTVGGKWTQPTPGIAGDYIAHVFKDYHLHVGDASHPTDSGNRTTLIEQNDRIKVVKNSDQAIGGNWSTSVGGQATIDANGIGGTIVLNAITNITLTVGGSSIVITPASIAITSPMVLINSGGPPPAPPIDPNVYPPQPPIPADRGDTQAPQK